MNEAGADVEQIVRTYAGLVYKLAFANAGNRSDADDVFQEVFLRYIRRQPVFRDPEHAKAWFIRVTLNRCHSLWSSAYRKRARPLADTLSYEMEEGEDLASALATLSPAYRSVVHLFYYEDMTTAQIAAALRRKEATVRTQLTRARQQLKHNLKGAYPDV